MKKLKNKIKQLERKRYNNPIQIKILSSYNLWDGKDTEWNTVVGYEGKQLKK